MSREKLNLIYCDYIASFLKDAINEKKDHKVPIKVTRLRFDLDEQGRYLGPDKFLDVEDCNGTSYTITITVRENE